MPEADKIKNILIIRFRRIGDAVLSSTLCTSLKDRFPNANIHYVLNEPIGDLFKHHPDIEKVITFSKEENSNIFKYIMKVRSTVVATKYDIIIDTRSTVKSILFSLFSLNTRHRIGRKKIYNKWIQNYRLNNYFDNVRDVVDTTLELLDPLVDKFDVKKNKNFRLNILDEEKNDYRKYLIDESINFDHPIVFCAVASRLEGKALNAEKMSILLNRILDKLPQAQLIFNFNGAMEKQIAESIHQNMNHDKRVSLNIEANDLRKLGALIANSDIFFGNEGGPRHIAQALDIPSFAIFPANVGKSIWLPNESENNQGVDMEYINMGKRNARTVKVDTTEFDKLIDIETVWIPFDKMLSRIFHQALI